jgi:type I restriction enzyme R subunit
LKWKTYYPYENKEQAKQNIKSVDTPTPQDYGLYSIFDKNNFLDILQNFTVFENENQKLIKKVPRYQQFQAVKKIAERVEKRDENG